MSTLFDDLLPARPSTSAGLPLLRPVGTGDGPEDHDAESARAQRAARDEARVAALLDGLNPPQRAAVVHSGTPLLIVAGAGSGKTRVLTHRIAHQLATGRVRPPQVLAITFTNKAAAEMRERVAALVGPAARAMQVSTFHSACVRILRREHEALGLRSSFSIYDAADSQRLVTLVTRELDLDPKKFPAKGLAHRIGNLKDELVGPDAYAASGEDEVLAAVYGRYQARLRQAHAMDFDDLITTTVRLLQDNPGVAEHYRRRFRSVLVDEYQDTNHAQYVLVKELAGQGEHRAELTVVGDADQSIYAFRGATIRNIVEFEADYPDATTILLEQNYRSTQTILSAANSVISRNPDRKPKRLWTDAGPGAQIVGYVADSEHEEARFVAQEIDRLGDEHGVRPGDVAVFYRTNAQSRALEEVLIRVGLPYTVVGGTRFYERREIKDAIAYLHAIANPDDDVNLRRVLNVPKRGIGDRSEAMLAAFAERERISFGAALDRAEEAPGIGSRGVTQLVSFRDLMARLRELAATGAGPATVLDEALDRSGYLAELRASDDPQDGSRVENLAELHAVATEFEQAEPDGTLSDFLERVSLVADADQIPAEDVADGAAEAEPKVDQGVVTLMTLHTAKGLEFPVVFVTGWEDGTFPHMRSLADEAQLAEERRLAYVGITRARQRLYLSRAAVRTAWGTPNELPASRFWDDVPEELWDWRRRESSMAVLRAGGSGWGGGASAWGRGAGGAGVRRGGTYGDELDDGPVIGSGRGPAGRPGSAGGVRPSAPPPRVAPGSSSPKAGAAIPNLEVGDRVTHDAYGLGRVVGLEGAGPNTTAKIDFGAQGTKRLLLRYSPVTKL